MSKLSVPDKERGELREASVLGMTGAGGGTYDVRRQPGTEVLHVHGDDEPGAALPVRTPEIWFSVWDMQNDAR